MFCQPMPRVQFPAIIPDFARLGRRLLSGAGGLVAGRGLARGAAC